MTSEISEELVEQLKCIGVGEGTPRFDGRTLIFSDREFRAAITLAFNAGRDARESEIVKIINSFQWNRKKHELIDAIQKGRAE